jgi:hypothetical protein
MRRRGQSGIDGQMLDAAALLVPFFYERMNRKADAALAFVEFADEHKRSNIQNATLALDNAQALIGELRASSATRDDATVVKAYERFLPVAIASPFDRREFAFEYARRLQLHGEADRAIEFYRLVPANDKRALQARFLELVALKQRIDDAPGSSPDRAQALAQIQKLADEVNRAVQTALSQATTDSQRVSAKSMLVRTSLLAADLARREQNDPQRALQLLEAFEQTVQGLPGAEALVNEAMYVRVQSFMAQEKYTDATQELVRLLNKTEGGRGAQIVYNLLEKLNADFDRAAADGNRAAMKTLARNRAELSGFLVKWAEENADPNVRKFTYRYKVFDAETQRRAAELEDTPEARQAGMSRAMDRYKALESPQNLELYKQSLPPAAAAEPNLYDAQVAFGIALIEYDLGNYSESAGRLSRLLSQRKIGTAVISIDDGGGSGEERVIDNDNYWEAILKLIRSNQKLGTSLEEAKSYLKMQYVTWGARVGGRKWKQEFEKLRQELIPEFKLEEIGGGLPGSES